LAGCAVSRAFFARPPCCSSAVWVLVTARLGQEGEGQQQQAAGAARRRSARLAASTPRGHLFGAGSARACFSPPFFGTPRSVNYQRLVFFVTTPLKNALGISLALASSLKKSPPYYYYLPPSPPPPPPPPRVSAYSAAGGNS
jgi:hypothetical protein